MWSSLTTRRGETSTCHPPAWFLNHLIPSVTTKAKFTHASHRATRWCPSDATSNTLTVAWQPVSWLQPSIQLPLGAPQKRKRLFWCFVFLSHQEAKVFHAGANTYCLNGSANIILRAINTNKVQFSCGLEISEPLKPSVISHVSCHAGFPQASESDHLSWSRRRISSGLNQI